MSLVVIVDYGMCNLDSVKRAVEECGGTPLVSRDAADLEKATHIILPGVGAFAQAMRNIRARSLDQALRTQALERRIPFLGICLGMQLMATKGYEGGETLGLDLIEGEVRRLVPDPAGTRIPHVGWNEVLLSRETPLFRDIASGRDFYFVHSYHFCCKDGFAIGRTPYSGGFVSIVGRDVMFGVQFHPEKSQQMGFQVLRNFLAL